MIILSKVLKESNQFKILAIKVAAKRTLDNALLLIRILITTCDNYSGVLDTYMKTDNYKAAEKIWKNLSGNDEHHDLIRRSPKLPGSKLYYKTASELIGQNKKLKSIFNDASKYHKKHY